MNIDSMLRFIHVWQLREDGKHDELEAVLTNEPQYLAWADCHPSLGWLRAFMAQRHAHRQLDDMQIVRPLAVEPTA